MDRLSELRNRITALCTACCVLALTACSDDTTGDDSRLPDGEYPMAFTAVVDGLTVTRAGTADGEWAITDRIAVQVSNAESGNDEIKIYAPSKIDGNSATLTSDDPFYWQSSNETKTVSAWYCGDSSTASGKANAGKVPTSWSVQSNQNEGESYQMSDFLYAAPKDISFGGTDKSLAFTHQTARVVINIKKAEAATEADVISSVVIGNEKNLALSGTYIAPTEGNATGAWNISNGTMGTITPKDITAGNGGDILKTYAALVIPQNMSDKKFIAVTLADNKTYYYTPQDKEANLESGKQYTYNITVKHGYLEVVTVKTDSEWGDGTPETVTSKEVAENFTEDDLKIGDYYYSDGKTSDGGLRKIYTDGSTKVEDIPPVLTDQNGSERTCIGIVYWVGDPTKPLRGREDQNLQGDKTLAKDHPACTHGLVVSLDEEECTWQASLTPVQDWLNSNHSDEFLSVKSGFDASDPLNNIQGYNNTKAIKAFNESPENSGSQVHVVQKVVEYRENVPAPAASSGWYVPSAKELTLLCGTDVDNIYINNSGTANYELINRKLELISGATTLSSSRYWSSTDYSRGTAFYVGFDRGGFVNASSKRDNSYRLRFSIAF